MKTFGDSHKSNFNMGVVPADKIIKEKQFNIFPGNYVDILDELDLIDAYRASIQKQQTTHFSQVHMEHSPGLTTCWATWWALVN